jgi:hypothetical protein
MGQRRVGGTEDAKRPSLDAETALHRGMHVDPGPNAEAFGLQCFGDAGDGASEVLVVDVAILSP